MSGDAVEAVDVVQLVDGAPFVVRVNPPGFVYPWVMRPDYARALSETLLQAADKVETADARMAES